ncbi:MAG: glycosyltransferase family 2 protein [Lachnospiraceae bacterium]|nr:glycosyltransferase family 2 protein [Lachnospiraceae bacterium]
MREKDPTLYIVIPCYNEEEILEQSLDILGDKLNRLISEGRVSGDSRILCVDDGSKDGTWDIIAKRASGDKLVLGLKFSRNYGHQNAILAGMLEARKTADCVVTIDADLQQDIEAMDDFLAKYMEGCDVVYGIRNDRNTDKAGKKVTAEGFYKLMRLMGADVIPNSADYRLLSAKALEALAGYPESNLFLRGLIPTMGFRSDVVYFDVKDRTGGKSKYTLGKMLGLALNGITSMSTRPLEMIIVVGLAFCLLALIIFILSMIDWARGMVVQGWTTTVALLCLIGGMNLLTTGLVGLYVGKAYIEVKHRPRYIIEQAIWDGNGTGGNEGSEDGR